MESPSAQTLDQLAVAEELRISTEFAKSLRVHPNLRRRALNPIMLVNPLDPKAGHQGPLKLRWYRDEDYRIWEEAKDLTARWGVSQRLAPHAQAWMKGKGLTAYCEIPAAFKSEEVARRSFMAYIKGKK